MREIKLYIYFSGKQGNYFCLQLFLTSVRFFRERIVCVSFLQRRASKKNSFTKSDDLIQVWWMYHDYHSTITSMMKVLCAIDIKEFFSIYPRSYIWCNFLWVFAKKKFEIKKFVEMNLKIFLFKRLFCKFFDSSKISKV
jgi:hypothetical protein